MKNFTFPTIYLVGWLLTSATVSAATAVSAESSERVAGVAVKTQIRITQTPSTALGDEATLSIVHDSGLTEFGGFEFLIQYDANALSLVGAYEGDIYTDYGWEYFTFRFNPDGGCPFGCQSGRVRITGLANLNNGQAPPGAFALQPGDIIVRLRFLVNNGREGNLLNCYFAPVRFYWSSCGDNALLNPVGDSSYISSFVYDYSGSASNNNDNRREMTDTSATLPSLGGAPDICVVSAGLNAPEPRRAVKYFNGGIFIVCGYDLFGGDLNLNRFPYEVGDVIMFARFFTNGLSAFGSHLDGSVSESDINGNGIPLELPDLVALIRIFSGKAPPPARLTHHPQVAVIRASGGVIASDVELGAALFEFAGRTAVRLLAENMTLAVGEVDGHTRALVYSLTGETIGAGEVVATSGKLLSIKLSDPTGLAMSAIPDGAIKPQSFALKQNYPNPFNPSTTISYSLPQSASVTLSIFNVLGRNVRTLKNTTEAAGDYLVEWDGTDAAHNSVASGLYYYRLTADRKLIATKKMILLK